jgi:hypothetical protein
MITCNLMGGLGNQLFQIFATISYAIKSRNQFKFTNATTLRSGDAIIRNTYWDSFLSRLKFFTTSEYPQLHVIRENGFTYSELPVDEMVKNDSILCGYFQSYKYFEEQFHTICRMIGLESLKDKLLLKTNYQLDYLNNAISMHFRIGDYKNLQNYHPIMKKDYYLRCLQHILDHNKQSDGKINVLYFCEDENVDEVKEIIHYLSNKLSHFDFVRGGEGLDDWEQMLLMSCCRHNIIENSSFSWWGAYFNEKNDKIVCYPSKWFGKDLKHDTRDLCPPEWIKIDA